MKCKLHVQVEFLLYWRLFFLQQIMLHLITCLNVGATWRTKFCFLNSSFAAFQIWSIFMLFSGIYIVYRPKKINKFVNKVVKIRVLNKYRWVTVDNQIKYRSRKAHDNAVINPGKVEGLKTSAIRNEEA